MKLFSKSFNILWKNVFGGGDYYKFALCDAALAEGTRHNPFYIYYEKIYKWIFKILKILDFENTLESQFSHNYLCSCVNWNS